MIFDEMRTRDSHKCCRIERHRVGGARATIEHRDLAQDRSGSLMAQSHLAPIAHAENDSHSSGDDDVEAVAFVAPEEDRFACDVMAFVGARGHFRDTIVVETGEKVDLLQTIGNVVNGSIGA
jgi:hypothetical protein